MPENQGVSYSEPSQANSSQSYKTGTHRQAQKPQRRIAFFLLDSYVFTIDFPLWYKVSRMREDYLENLDFIPCHRLAKKYNGQLSTKTIYLWL